ncbi:MAG: hypothetical protein IJV11_12935 [Muribaculaceae bacterium]|nr:hypothetical protein [Muribaculaceae bacterium]
MEENQELINTQENPIIARYSILKGNEQLFAAKYLPMLPTEEVLRREIEQQKEIFYLQHNKK